MSLDTWMLNVCSWLPLSHLLSLQKDSQSAGMMFAKCHFTEPLQYSTNFRAPSESLLINSLLEHWQRTLESPEGDYRCNRVNIYCRSKQSVWSSLQKRWTRVYSRANSSARLHSGAAALWDECWFQHVNVSATTVLARWYSADSPPQVSVLACWHLRISRTQISAEADGNRVILKRIFTC